MAESIRTARCAVPAPEPQGANAMIGKAPPHAHSMRMRYQRKEAVFAPKQTAENKVVPRAVALI